MSKIAWGLSLVTFCIISGNIKAQNFQPEHDQSIIVKWKGQRALHLLSSEVLSEELNIGLINPPAGILSTDDYLEQLRHDPNVEYAQYNHLLKDRLAPNDERYNEQWSLKSKPRNHVGMEEAWDVTTGTETFGQVVVAVIDGGVDITHPDLKDNIWTNAGEIVGNKIDDDGNGYVDDVNGWNAYSDNGEIINHRHGTHVAGIVGARGDNHFGITGINWQVGIMPISGSSVSTATVIKAYAYVLKQKILWLESSGNKGANVVATNSSFGVDYADCNSKDFPAWNDLFNQMGHAGILSVAATANLNINIDEKGDVPTGCSSSYLVTVTNTTSTGAKYDSAGIGLKSVDLGAPGTAILSTLPDNTYGPLTGTSMSTPHVSGAIALMMSAASPAFWEFYRQNPDPAVLQLKDILLQSTTPESTLAQKTVSGGILNIKRAVDRIQNWSE